MECTVPGILPTGLELTPLDERFPRDPDYFSDLHKSHKALPGSCCVVSPGGEEVRIPGA